MPDHIAIYFGVLAIMTTLASVTRGAISARAWIGLPVGAIVVGVVAWTGALITGERDLYLALAIASISVTFVVKLLLRRWSWLGAQLFVAASLASITYLTWATTSTFGVGGGPIYVAASTLLLLLELAALLLAISYLFEIVDTLGRSYELPIPSDPAFQPRVAIQVPTYSEPLEVVSETLDALAALDYPDLMIQVVDNNTPDRKNWTALEAYCQKLGPRFHFMHLEDWPGFKAGALNEAMRRLPKDVEIIGVVDADYVVNPEWLRSVIGHFANPKVAFVQTPQSYRDWNDDQYLRGLYYSYQYFFDITMPCRAHRNAIIFAGTMGLIRRRALEEVGGWNEEVVTEDAEASLRMLAQGYDAVYVSRAYGHGLMPLSFDGLKKQRFRWALGGVQILRLHWRRLLLGRDAGRLTAPQRIHYLLGNVQWFGDVLMFCFTVLLLLTALSTAMHQELPIRRLSGLVIGLPIAFLASGLYRAIWAMRLKSRCSLRDAVAGLQVWFALSWVVALACLRGLVSSHATFLRTPKERDGEASLVKALRTSQVESMLAIAGFVAAALMVWRSASVATGAVAVLLLFQSAVYANAPWAGASAEGIHLNPLRRAYRTSAQNTGFRPGLGAATIAVPFALVIAGLVVIALVSIVPPSPELTQLPPPAAPAPPAASSPSPSATPSLATSSARTSSPARTSP